MTTKYPAKGVLSVHALVIVAIAATAIILAPSVPGAATDFQQPCKMWEQPSIIGDSVGNVTEAPSSEGAFVIIFGAIAVVLLIVAVGYYLKIRSRRQ